MENAVLKREGLRAWKVARAVDDLQRDERLKDGRRAATEYEILQNSWITIIVAFQAVAEMHDRMLKRMRSMNEQRAERYSQLDSILYKSMYARERLRLIRAATIIWRGWKRARKRILHRKQVRGILLIRKFIKDLGESVKISLAIKKKLKFVRELQRRFRLAKELRQIRKEIGVMQFGSKLLAQYQRDEDEIKRLRIVHRAYERDIANKKGLHRLVKTEKIAEHRQQTEEQINFLTQRQRAAVTMSKELQQQVVAEAVNKKTIEFGNRAYRYGIALRQWDEEYKGRQLRGEQNIMEAMPPKPIKPYMSCVFSEVEIPGLIQLAMRLMPIE